MKTHKIHLVRNDARSSDTDPRLTIDHKNLGSIKVWGEPSKRRRGKGVYVNGYLEIPTEYGPLRLRPEMHHYMASLPPEVSGATIDLPTPKVTFHTDGSARSGPGASGGSAFASQETSLLEVGDLDALAAFYAATVPGMATATGNPTAACKRFAEGKLAKHNAATDGSDDD